ncbi:MFS general substrate transporter [Amanita rubescens]|nr:MFS general substrate transporter [Amanita rubescens]
MERENTAVASPKSYSIYTRNEKWFIVSLTALAGLFRQARPDIRCVSASGCLRIFNSPLTANIYLPAIPEIAIAFHKSTELINVTVTVYMVFQGVAPMIWGTLSDIYGRRLIFLACLLVLALSCVGLALVPTSAYWLLVLLRCCQAAGSASTIALGAGVIGDISTREERGGFFGLFTLGPMVGPAIGPVLGGVLSNYLGWRSIFWFLCIAATTCLIVMILFLPETLRAIVDDGSITPPVLYRPVISLIGRDRDRVDMIQRPTRVKHNPLRLFMHADILGLLAVNAIINSSYYVVLATISTLFQEAYPFLNETTIGLCFLSSGGGMIVGSFTMGKMLDWEYQTFKRKAISQAAVGNEKHDSEEQVTRDNMFPLEKARLRLLPFLLVVYVIVCAGYGWCLEKKSIIAGPLILQFVMSYMAIVVMNSTSTLMIDLVPAQGSSITACSNLVRCTSGAVFVSVVQLMINKIGTGWTYVVFAGLLSLAIPLIQFVIFIGPSCRLKRSQH